MIQPTMLISKPSQTTLTGNTLLSRKSKTKHNHPTQLFLAHLTLDNSTCQPCREIPDLLGNQDLFLHVVANTL